MERIFDCSMLSLETLVAASPLLGHDLEDRTPIREAQDWDLVQQWQMSTSTRLSNAAQQDLFCVAPLDFLVTRDSSDLEFHMLELNGTGIGGLTNMSLPVVNSVLQGMSQMAISQTEDSADPLILIASSGRESTSRPRLNKLIYEKLMYAEACRSGFRQVGRSSHLLTMPTLLHDPASLPRGGATVVVGYIREFLEALSVDESGRLLLGDRVVTGMINDRFCLNVGQKFAGALDWRQVATMNRCHLAGADKSVAYGLLNDFLRANPQPYFPAEVRHEVANSREELIGKVREWLRNGQRPVIKPAGTGLGHGIEFFAADLSEQQVNQRVDRSLRLTEDYYQRPGGAFPYTVCPFVDACTVERPEHPLNGHKYELRVVVYRDGAWLKAFPSIIKVAADRVALEGDAPRGLINNITASCMQTQAKGTDFMFPLANAETLKIFGLGDRQVRALCQGATGYVAYVLDQLQRNPQRFGFPRQSGRPVNWLENTPQNGSPPIWPRQDLLATLSHQ